VIRCPHGSANVTFQSSTGEEPVLLAVTSALKPSCRTLVP
jgi:hypothetical protein